MSRIIELLELAGRDPAAFSTAALEGLTPEAQAAVLRGDRRTLADGCQARPWLNCYVSAPDNEPVPDEQPDETPSDIPADPDAAAA